MERTMIKKLLIANRGEIACRIIKTAKRLGIHTIAVYSEIDACSQHVIHADEAHCVGPAPSTQSYLNAEKIIEVALDVKADAIHPGYGFLAENPDFARSCHEHQIIFVGPPAEAMEIMANKNQAKALLEAANIPVIPGYNGEKQDPKTIKQSAKAIGVPLLLKAAAGGGGKGMRLVENLSELEDAITSAKRESKASFGDDTIFIEKYLPESRHIELQIFADTHSNKVQLFDRDCSVQRRHQKIIEEAPAPNLSAKTREKMAASALAILDTIEYVGAGTIEFLVDESENFYFMEMNTRLQVEHPVTEMITQLDLVEWQLRVASGEPLPLKQKQIKQKGHAFEARICAENPAQDFTPSTGQLTYFSIPDDDTGIRVDTGFSEGDNISMHYDSMIGKIISFADNRENALLQLHQALTEIHIVGVATNTEFLANITQNRDFRNAKINTRFIEQHSDLLAALNQSIPNPLLALASLAQCARLQAIGYDLAQCANDTNSPWFFRDGWRAHGRTQTKLQFWQEDALIPIMISTEGDQHTIELPEESLTAQIIWHDDYRMSISIDKDSINATVVPFDTAMAIFSKGQQFILHTQNPKAQQLNQSETETHLCSSMPGTIVEINIKPKQKVKKGEKLLVLEAMKMEHKITAPSDGVIKNILCQIGDSIVEGVDLIEFETL